VRKQRNKELHFQCTFYHQPKLKKSRLLFFNFENGVITHHVSGYQGQKIRFSVLGLIQKVLASFIPL